MLDPLPVIDADRRDFETLRRAVSGEIVISRARRDVEGRELGLSSLWPVDAMVEHLQKSAPAGCPISEGDRLQGRSGEFKAGPGAAGLETWRAWHRPDVTVHDGKVRPDHPLVLAALERTWSASTIALILTDPCGWLFRQVMGLGAPEIEDEPFEFPAPDFGNLVHAILERASRILSASGGKSAALGDVVAAVAAEVAKSFEFEVPVPPKRIWRSTLRKAAAMAEMALDPKFLVPLSGQRTFAEIPFGREAADPDPTAPWDIRKPVTIAGVRVSGKVDRLDMAKDGKSGRVVDWKSGRLPEDVADWIINGGAEVQRAIYAAAAVQLAGVESVEAGLAYLKGGAVFVPIPDTAVALKLIEERLGAMREAARSGLLLPGPNSGSRNNDVSFALPGDAKIRYLEEKQPAILEALGPAAAVWEDR
jgi:RecB family exonuclease